MIWTAFKKEQDDKNSSKMNAKISAQKIEIQCNIFKIAK